MLSAGHTGITGGYDFSGLKTVADIGGGYGGLMFHILNTNPAARGIIADLPYMKNEVEKEISARNLGDRCSFYGCNFFEDIPGNSDCLILSNILHDWGDGECETILKNCKAAMPPDGVLLVIESVLPDRNEFSVSSLLDLEVLVMGGGKERTGPEYSALLNRAGFRIDRGFR